MHVALLRGINVGKAKRIAMADLRTLCESLGYGHVQTLLNSGNLVFSAPRADPRAAVRIEKEIASRLGVQSRVLVITGSELDAVPIPVSLPLIFVNAVFDQLRKIERLQLVLPPPCVHASEVEKIFHQLLKPRSLLLQNFEIPAASSNNVLRLWSLSFNRSSTMPSSMMA